MQGHSRLVVAWKAVGQCWSRGIDDEGGGRKDLKAAGADGWEKKWAVSDGR